MSIDNNYYVSVLGIEVGMFLRGCKEGILTALIPHFIQSQQGCGIVHTTGLTWIQKVRERTSRFILDNLEGQFLAGLFQKVTSVHGNRA